MYNRLKQFTFSNNNETIYTTDSTDSHNMEEIKIDKYNHVEDNVQDDGDDRDDEDNGNEYKDRNNLKNKILHILKFIIGGGLKTSIFTGLSNSWFMTCCIGIFTRHYIIYKLSNKTPEDYNNMVKNITIKISTKNIFFTKIFQAFANNNNLVDKDLFNYFITYTDNVRYDTNEIDYDGLYDLINIATKHGDDLTLDSDIPIKSGNIALVYTGKLNGKNIVIKYRRNNITEKFNKSMNELRLLVNISKKMPYLCDLNIDDLFEENLEIMINQLDFLNEVKNIEIFYEKFKDVNTICIPKV